MALKNDVTINNDFVVALVSIVAVFVFMITLMLQITGSVNNSDDRKAEVRIAEVEACADLEEAAERTLCMQED